MKQYNNKADCFGPVDDSMGGCKPIKFLHPYTKQYYCEYNFNTCLVFSNSNVNNVFTSSIDVNL